MQTEFWEVGDIWPLQDQSSFQKQSRAVQSRLELGEFAVDREAGHEAVAGEIQQGPQPPRATDSGGCATGNPEGSRRNRVSARRRDRIKVKDNSPVWA